MHSMNRLSREKSAYLKHAARQKVDWYPWSEEAFERAKSEDKPVFLSTGAIWCHWCHVMAKECFENERIVKMMNELFINIKLDRDERPDIDRRYQQAVAAMGGGSGWPLSVFLTHEGKPFYGGTYFPPEDNHGRPGFGKVLMTVADFYRTKRDAVADFTRNLLDYLKPERLSAGEIHRGISDKAESAVLSEFDAENGGFGAFPKFPMPGAIEFLINRHFAAGNEATGYAIKKTLEAMARGGFHDQLEGGFHRYSTDAEWLIPHFEKMADDNAWLLKNYIDAYFLFGDEYFREVAEGISRFVRDVLSDPEGGFYASQDADVTPDDEGGYFTWTDGDFRKGLNDEEYRVLSLHFLGDKGSMHHDPSKKVLCIARAPETIAEETGMEADGIKEVIARGRIKLLEERNRRKAPLVDTALYTSLNGMLASSFLHAFRVLGDKGLRDAALKSIERILNINSEGDELLHSEGVKAVLEDYVHIVRALVNAYEVTGGRSYLERADRLMQTCIAKFWDGSSGGFFDTETEVLGGKNRTIEDIPHPSANSLGIIQMLKLYNMTDKEVYYRHAETSLKVFSGRVQDMGIHAGCYFSALGAYYHLIRVAVEASPESALAGAAITSLNPYGSLVYGEDRGCVTPCINGVCLEPISDPRALRAFLRNPS
jgi:uncharacterized protein YyaL (SSP411 family)